MSVPRLTTRSLLVGTALFAVWGTLILNYDQIESSSAILVGPLWLLLFLLPFAAAGRIVGSAMRGVTVGFLFYTAWVALAALLGHLLFG